MLASNSETSRLCLQTAENKKYEKVSGCVVFVITILQLYTAALLPECVITTEPCYSRVPIKSDLGENFRVTSMITFELLLSTLIGDAML